MEKFFDLYRAVKGLSGRWRYLTAFLLGAIVPLALAPFYIIPVLVISFTGLVWLLDGIERGPKSWRSAALIGWTFGFGFHLTGLYWIGFAFLVDAAQFAWAIPFAITLMPAGLALFTAAAMALAHRFWSNGVDRIWILALAFTFFEFLRGTILTGFPWNLIGYSWIGFLPVAQSASLFGIYGLTLFTCLVAAAPAALTGGEAENSLDRKGLLNLGGLAGVLLITGIWGAVHMGSLSRQGVEGVVLRIVQPSIPQKEKWKDEFRYRNFDTYLEMTAADAGPGQTPTHIIWPESAVPIFLANNDAARGDIAKVLQPGQTLLTGAVRYQRVENASGQLVTRIYNSFHTIDDEGAISGTYDKFHLVPFGEYLPLSALLSRLGMKKLTEGVGAYSAGSGPKALNVVGAGSFAPLICYEAIFPSRMPKERPDWIINVTNDAWYGNTTGPRQHLAQSQMRAIEQGLPLVRAANTGISAVVDSKGRIWSRIPLGGRGILQSPLPRTASKTMYAHMGNAVFLALLLAITIAISVRRFAKIS